MTPKIPGHSAFRAGQQWAVDRVLAGRSSLVVLPTGAGKSLCFQLPARRSACILKGLTVVVSPLVALIDEQISRLPPEISAVSLSGGSLEVRARALRDMEAGRVDVVYVSPERLCSRAFAEAFRKSGRECALLAVDEAHCVSQWSHNFRPAFSKIGAVARKHLQPKCTLALTATASRGVIREICAALGLDAGDAASGGDVQRAGWRRSNLELRVVRVRDGDDDAKLEALLTGKASMGASIVYVRAQYDADRISEKLREHGVAAHAYHAGLPRGEREKAARDFETGKAKVVVATVAFGMGVDKADVRCVVHYCAPPSLERYVQEIGRAGRDGAPSKCVCLFASSDAKRNVSLAAADGITPAQVKLFARRYLRPARGAETAAGAHVSAAPIDICAKELNMRPEVVETIVALLEREGVADCIGKGPDRLRFRLRQHAQQRPVAPPPRWARLVGALSECSAKAPGDDGREGWRIASLCATVIAGAPLSCAHRHPKRHLRRRR
ncbi:P-loop containing nucleoside triphosphate hydrolase protein [Pelagophyceae sp. CCMP2097]|nr:P-loop containing nucleoside triphosphate hydrolase protein [Pelagophyceae sp. CCMP2097]